MERGIEQPRDTVVGVHRDFSGNSVALSADGAVLAVGSYNHDTGKGLARVYDWNGVDAYALREDPANQLKEEIRELKKQLQEAKGREDALLEVINRCRWGESAERGGNVLGRAMRASLLRWFEPAFTVAP